MILLTVTLFWIPEVGDLANEFGVKAEAVGFPVAETELLDAAAGDEVVVVLGFK